ncbi:MAG: DUF2157 domain-containing protein [Micromonosporaceae bacterium]
MADDDRLTTALGALVDEGTLTPDQAHRVAQVLRADAVVPAGASRAVIEAGGYVGGALVAGGAGLVVSYFWDDLSNLTRLGVALGATLVLVVAALLAGLSRGRLADSPVRGRLASTLGAFAALVAGGAAELLRELLVDRYADDWLFGFQGLGVALVAVPLYAAFRRVPLLLAVWYAGAALMVELGQQLAPDRGIWSWGWLMAAYGAIWLSVAVARLVPESGAAGFLGGAAGLVGAEYLATYSRSLALVGLLIGAAFVVACFVSFARDRQWPVLVAAVLIALLVPTSAVVVLFDSSLAGGVTLIVVGAALLAGGLALLSRRRPAAGPSAGPDAGPDAAAGRESVAEPPVG